jgi:hypothetical protein
VANIVLLLVLAAPFAIVGALVCLMVIVIGRQTTRRS